MAQLINQDGTTTEVLPSNGTDFTLEEMQGYVKGYIELVYLPFGKIMVINEEGKFRDDFGINQEATRIAHENKRIFPNDYIVGPALICEEGEVR